MDMKDSTNSFISGVTMRGILRRLPSKMYNYHLYFLFNYFFSCLLQVLSKGQVIHTKTIKKKSYGRSTVKLPCKLYALASPSMRVVAYYYATLGNQSEFVGHSLLVDTEDACVEEVRTYKQIIS